MKQTQTTRDLPPCIWRRHYKSGAVFYRVVIAHKGVNHHVGSFPDLNEAIRRRDEWKARKANHKSVLQTLRNQGPAGKALADVFTNSTKSKP